MDIAFAVLTMHSFFDQVEPIKLGWGSVNFPVTNGNGQAGTRHVVHQ